LLFQEKEKKSLLTAEIYVAKLPAATYALPTLMITNVYNAI